MNKKVFIWILILILLAISVTADPLELSNGNSKIKFHDVNNFKSNFIDDSEVILTDNVIAFKSEAYTGMFDKLKFWKKSKGKIAEITFDCESGNMYQVYKYDKFTNSKKQIQSEGYPYTTGMCFNSELTIQLDSFSSYTIAILNDWIQNLTAGYWLNDTSYNTTGDIKDSLLTNNGTGYGKTFYDGTVTGATQVRNLNWLL